MSSRLYNTARLVQAPLRHSARRSYASEAAKELQFPEETFGTNAWRNTLLAVIAGFVWYRVDQHITGQGEEKHPFTKWIEYRMITPSAEKDRLNNESLDEANKFAEHRLLTQTAQRPPVYRMRYADSFHNASPRGASAGLQCNLSDLKVRSD
ncbi:hypothetical protein VTP01DRAFT_10004 [Rhizomucor pusillus]|uniref:uncharacterized protein n=1 Tax=Rhizomucor pusillus TaxID=4840 RepID=UPI003742CF33